MAYKFQIGDARLSGSLVQEGSVTAESSAMSASSITLPDGGISLNGTAVSSTAAELNLLDGATAGTVVNNKAVIYSAAGVVQGTDFNGPDGFDIGNDSVNDFIRLNASEIIIKDGALDFDIASHDRSNGLKLGGTLVTATATELNYLSGAVIANNGGVKAALIDGSNNLQVSNNLTVTGNATIIGNLTVQGTTTTIESATFIVTSSVFFEGTTPDDYEIQLTTADPTTDRTITLPDLTGHVPLLADAVSNANVTAAEFALLDGGSTINSVSNLADGDGFLCNDGGTMKQVRLDSLATFIGSAGARATGYNIRTLDLNTISDGGQISITPSSDGTGFYGTQDNHTASFSIGLSGSWTSGDLVIVKSNESGSQYPITIYGSGSQIDGEDSVTLESAYAAISLIYDGQNWNIM